MARRKDSAEVGPAIKGALKRAMMILEERKRPLSTIWVNLFEDDPATAMRLAISILPKEMDVTTTNLSPEQWLEAMSDASQSESAEPATAVQEQLH